MNLGCHGTPKFLSKKISNERTRPTKNGQNGPLQSSRDNKNWTIESCANSNDLSRRGPPEDGGGLVNRKGNPPKSPRNSGLGSILICPD